MGALTFAPSLVLAVGGPCQGSSSLAASHICNHFLTELVRLGPRHIVALVPHQPWIGPWFVQIFALSTPLAENAQLFPDFNTHNTTIPRSEMSIDQDHFEIPAGAVQY